jgi:hypothetical protein
VRPRWRLGPSPGLPGAVSRGLAQRSERSKANRSRLRRPHVRSAVDTQSGEGLSPQLSWPQPKRPEVRRFALSIHSPVKEARGYRDSRKSDTAGARPGVGEVAAGAAHRNALPRRSRCRGHGARTPIRDRVGARFALGSRRPRPSETMATGGLDVLRTPAAALKYQPSRPGGTRDAWWRRATAYPRIQGFVVMITCRPPGSGVISVARTAFPLRVIRYRAATSPDPWSSITPRSGTVNG